MNVRPPLTRTQLHDIAVRKDPNDIIPLLWEIKRMRALVLRIDQLQRSLNIGGGPGMLLDCLRKDLVDEPCVKEFPRLESDKR